VSDHQRGWSSINRCTSRQPACRNLRAKSNNLENITPA